MKSLMLSLASIALTCLFLPSFSFKVLNLQKSFFHGSSRSYSSPSFLSAHSSTTTQQSDSLQWLLSENSKIIEHQNEINRYLLSKSIDLTPIKDGKNVNSFTKIQRKTRIVESTPEKSYFCRLSLCNADVGEKLISPCGCTGSQQWIKISEINRMRRLDPILWKKCLTCQQDYDYSPFYKYSNLPTALLSYILDHRWVLRSIIFVMTSTILSFLPLQEFYHKFLTSAMLWQLYPQWQFIYRLPLLFQFWFLQTIGYGLLYLYRGVEDRLVNYLVNIESHLISNTIPLESNT